MSGSSAPVLKTQLLRSQILLLVDDGHLTVSALSCRLGLQVPTIRSHVAALVAGGHLRVSALRVAGSQAKVYEVTSRSFVRAAGLQVRGARC